jgi:uncharacterized membrane-anchored protein
MADPFGIAQGLANFLQTDVQTAGFMLGAVLSVCLLIMLEWTIGSRGTGADNAQQTMFISVILGVVISRLIGWFPDWVVLFTTIAILGAWILLKGD